VILLAKNNQTDEMQLNMLGWKNTAVRIFTLLN
jgi:hypothetical protein